MRVAIVPGVLAFLPEYAGLEDPVADVRAASLAAAAWVAEAGPVRVVADAQGARVGAYLLGADADAGATSSTTGGGVLVVANGSARRTDTSPGYVDERAIPFDDLVEAALRGPEPEVLANLDIELARDLLLGNPEGLVALAELLRDCRTVGVDYAAAPFGVGYWVARWSSGGDE